MSDFSASETPADRSLTSVVSVIDDPARSAMLAALAGALPAAITSVFLDRGWLTRASGRRLRVTDSFDDRIDQWLAT